MMDKAAVACGKAAHRFGIHLVFFHEAQDFVDREAAAAGRNHGAFSADDVVAVDHASLPVCRHGNAADVADHVVAVLILFAHDLLAVHDRGPLEVQRMHVYRAIQSLEPCHTGQILQFARVGRIDYKGTLSVLIGKVLRPLQRSASRKNSAAIRRASCAFS